MALISYDVSIDPSNPEVQLGISAVPSSITVEVENIGDYSLSVQPSTGTIVGGVVAGAILGGFLGLGVGALLGGSAGVGTVYAVGELIKSALQSGIGSGLKGQNISTDFYTPPHPLGYSIQVEGVDVKVEAATVKLDTYNSMLMITGTVKVS
jgi:hypothetical protein